MLGIVLKILSILGIVLLVALALLFLGLLLLCFFPFTYRIRGSKDAEGLRFTVKVNWLFGLFRVRYRYPESGHLTAKVLCFTLFDMGIPPKISPKKAAGKEDSGKAADAESVKNSGRKAIGTSDTVAAPADTEQRSAAADSGNTQEEKRAKQLVGEERSNEIVQPMGEGYTNEESSSTKDASASPKGLFGKISQKIQGIKYTINNIYDKIKKIWENISYYIELLQEENTKQLAAHAFFRLRKVMKGVWPKSIRVRLLFGTGSPDTTGYLYGAYCMLSAPLGTDFQVTPDFEQKRLEGEFDIAGHVIVWIFVINGLKLVLDKKLRLFLKQLKKVQKKLKKAPA